MTWINFGKLNADIDMVCIFASFAAAVAPNYNYSVLLSLAKQQTVTPSKIVGGVLIIHSFKFIIPGQVSNIANFCELITVILC